jgi:four helix bundle protein
MSKIRSQSHNAKAKPEARLVSETQGFAYQAKPEDGARTGKDILKVRSYKFAVAVVRFVDGLENHRAQFSIRDQLIRSATSVGANIVEARAASSRRDFLRFYEIALKSSNETKFWLCLLRDAFDIDRSKIEPLLQEVTELSNMLAASILTMKNKR